jgi:hypothetical protein
MMASISNEPAADVAAAVEELRVLVSGEGADFELTSYDDHAATLNLKLTFGAETCSDCVMPQDVLETIALEVVKRRLPVTAVHIDDPRAEP